MRRRTFVGLGAAAAGVGLATGGGIGVGRHVEAGTAAAREEADGYAAGLSREHRAPSGVRRMVWSVQTTEPVMALTFDDGPDPAFTPTVLEILARYGVRAQFHVLGWNALNHPDLVRAVVAGGHEIGNHTFTHQDLAYETPAGTLLQLERGRQSIVDVVGERSIRWFRPPRGRLTGVATRYAAELGHDIVLWSLTTGGREQTEDVRAYLTRRLHPGAIVALHDGIGRGTFLPSAAFARDLSEHRAAEVRALPAVLEHALDAGYRFVTVSELVELDKP
ncbi:MAG TPA: polysaccharide deacetylase family protein [Acidimicrobiales bacterium]